MTRELNVQYSRDDVAQASQEALNNTRPTDIDCMIFYDRAYYFSSREYNQLPQRFKEILDETSYLLPPPKARTEEVFDMIFVARIYGIDLLIELSQDSPEDISYGLPYKYRQRLSSHIKENEESLKKINEYREEVEKMALNDKKFEQYLTRHRQSNTIKQYGYKNLIE